MTSTVTDPGVYDIGDDEYHHDPTPTGSLSSTEIRRLLDAPAKFDWARRNGTEHKDVFDFGSAAHSLVLGVGRPIVVLEHDDWRSKAARDERDDAYRNDYIPLLRKDWERVEAMAAALRLHPLASALLNPDRGQPEQSAFWFDRVWRRARFDWLPDVDPNRRLIIPDYKTANRADTRSFARSAASFGYHIQAAHYLAGAKATLNVAEPAFVFIVQEKDPPYLVNVVELDPYALQIGAALVEQAVDIYLRCTETGKWPGYGTEVNQACLPRWAEIEFEENQ